MKLSDHRRGCMAEVLSDFLRVAHYAHSADAHFELGADWRDPQAAPPQD